MSRDGDRRIIMRMLPLVWVATALFDLAATHWHLAFLHLFIAWLVYSAECSSKLVADVLAGWRQANDLSTRAIAQLKRLEAEQNRRHHRWGSSMSGGSFDYHGPLRRRAGLTLHPAPVALVGDVTALGPQRRTHGHHHFPRRPHADAVILRALRLARSRDPRRPPEETL